MTHRCTILRSSGVADSWGQEDSDYTPLVTGQVCRAWFASEQLVIAAGELAGVTTRHLALPVGTDVTEDDRIGDVADLYGRIVFDGIHTIDELVQWPDRVELILRRAD